MNRGRAALLDVLRRTRVEFVAARLRVTRSAVYNWAAGIRRPSKANRKRISTTYGIPAKTWDELTELTRVDIKSPENERD